MSAGTQAQIRWTLRREMDVCVLCSFEQVAGGITQVLAGRDQRSASEREG